MKTYLFNIFYIFYIFRENGNTICSIIFLFKTTIYGVFLKKCLFKLYRITRFIVPNYTVYCTELHGLLYRITRFIVPIRGG